MASITISAFPTNDLGGPYPVKVVDFPTEYATVDYDFEDGGYECNVSPCGIQRWQIVYEGLTAAEAATLDAHFDLAKGEVNNFSYNSRDTNTYTGVQYSGYKKARHVKKDIQARTVDLVRYF